MTTAQLNTQVASTVQTQLATISSAVTGGSTLAEAETASITNAKDAGLLLANASTAGKNYFTSLLSSGLYSFQSPNNIGSINISKQIASGTTTALTTSNTDYEWTATSKAWLTSTPINSIWYLTPTSKGGWVEQTSTASKSMKINTDSTITYKFSASGASVTFIPQEIKLDGKPLGVCNTSPAGNLITCNPSTDVYPQGSIRYQPSNINWGSDTYSISTGSGAMTDGNGTPLTTLPTLGTDICVGNTIFTALPNPLENGNNYTAISTNSCSPTDIATAKKQPRLAIAPISILITSKATGNSTVPTVLFIPRGYSNSAAWGITRPTMNALIAEINGAIKMGIFHPKGPSANTIGVPITSYLNKIAIDADLQKAGASAATP